MFVRHFSFFVFLCVLLVNANIVWSKRGCASFGHSCFGGHGKRSQQPDVLGQSFLESSQELISQQYPQKSDSLLEEQYSSMDDNIGRPKNDVRTLLKKLAKLYDEDQRLHQKYMNKYFNK